MLKCHSSLPHNVFIFCRASFLPFLPLNVELYLRVFWTIPWFRTINIHLTTSIAFVSVHCHRPSAWEATPSNGDSLKPMTLRTRRWAVDFFLCENTFCHCYLMCEAYVASFFDSCFLLFLFLYIFTLYTCLGLYWPVSCTTGWYKDLWVCIFM